MNEQLKTICFILITLAILVSAGFYCWSTYQKIDLQYQKINLEYCKIDLKYCPSSNYSDRILFPGK